MKKNTIISAIAIGLGFFLTTSVQAIHPVHYTGLLLNIENEMDSQKELVVQDWMLSAEAFSMEKENSIEPRLDVKPWMLDRDEWSNNDPELNCEPEIKVQGWMMRIDEIDHKTIALEDWMLKING